MIGPRAVIKIEGNVVGKVEEQTIDFNSEKCEHEWEDYVDTCTTVDGDGWLVLTCKKCGYMKRLEDT